MMAFELQKRNHWKDTVEESVLEQYRESPRWQAILKAVIDKLNDIDDASVDFQELLDYTKDATGKRLDWLSGLVGIRRLSGENDASLHRRFIFRIKNSQTGTPDHILLSLLNNYGILSPVYFEESPATFFIYCPFDRQVPINNIKKLSPAGVRGLPAAAIVLANGKRLVTRRGAEVPFTDDDGNEITDGDGNTITFKPAPDCVLLGVAREENIGNTKQKNLLTEDGKVLVTEDGLTIKSEG